MQVTWQSGINMSEPASDWRKYPVASLYDSIGKDYEAAYAGIPAQQRSLQWILSQLPHQGCKVLDIGCGTGAPVALSILIRSRRCMSNQKSPIMSFTKLGSEIQKHCMVLDAYIAAENLPMPSFDPSGPLEFPITSSTPKEVLESRQYVLDATRTLHDLTAGPAATLVWQALTVSNQYHNSLHINTHANPSTHTTYWLCESFGSFWYLKRSTSLIQRPSETLHPRQV